MSDAQTPIGYAFDEHWLKKVRGIGARLNEPRALTFDDRRDLANLLDLFLSECQPVMTADELSTQTPTETSTNEHEETRPK